MVGPLMLQKILHCRNSNINKQGKRQRNKRSSTNRNIKRLEETCRICLNIGTIPIIKSASNKDLMSSINTFGAINMHPDDAHPKHICQSCYNLLKSAIKFRKTAQESDKLLCKKSINLPEINISVEHSYSYSSDAHNVDDGNVSDQKEILTHDSIMVLQDETNVLCPKEETYSEHSFINDENTDSNQSINQENHSKTKTEISKHLKNLQGEEEECNDQNETINSKEKKKRPRLRCKRCDLHFNNLNDYTEHRLSLEHENKRVTCNVCNKTYAPQYLKKHMLLHTPNSKQIIDVCDVCGKSFKHRGLLSRHRLTHTYELPFQCSLCPYKGRCMTALRMHMRSHTGERPYPCPTCPSKFVSKSNLNKHMLTHKETFDFHCEACGRGFHTKRTLEMHIRADHNGVKEHKCRFCGKEFGYRKLVIKHELKVHKREKMRSGRMPIYLKVEAMKQKNQIENTRLMQVELDNGNIKSAI